MKTPYFLLPLAVLILALTACGQRDNNSQNQNPNAFMNPMMGQGFGTGQYQFMNGQCYQAGTGQVVPQQFCMNGGMMNGGMMNGGMQFQFVNGQCVYTMTGQPVALSYCSAGGGFMNGGVGGGFPQQGAQQCVGVYIYNANGQSQAVQCNGPDCRGYTLTEQATGRQVACQ
jgi:hypothetical protein